MTVDTENSGVDASSEHDFGGLLQWCRVPVALWTSET